MSDIVQCCYLYKDGDRCDKLASFEIIDANRQDPDNYTHACEDHVGHLLGTTVGRPTCKQWIVTELD